MSDHRKHVAMLLNDAMAILVAYWGNYAIVQGRHPGLEQPLPGNHRCPL